MNMLCREGEELKPRSVEGLESSRPKSSESLKATKCRPHQVRISNPQKTSQSESVGPMPPSYY